MLEEGTKAVRLIISGKVQGVWYRDWTVRNATELNLDGWVRNRADGTVEAIFVGEDLVVDEMVSRCNDGPPLAKVSHVDVNPARGIVGTGFKQKPTVDLNERRGE